MNGRKECMALLLSGPSFESFYGNVMHLTCEQYLASYRNDFSFMYAYALADLDVDVVIYMPAWTCRGKHQIDDRIFARFLPLSSWYELWRRYRFLSRTPYGRYVSSYANIRAFAQPLIKGLAEDNATVLYIQEYWTARFDYLVRTVPVPVIGSDHGGKRKGELTFRKRGSFQRAAAITCQTLDECAEVRAFGHEPTLLRNGVDTSFYSPRPDIVRTKSVLIVARLTDRQKRMSDLIRAMQYLPEGWVLQIAGSGPDEGTLKQLAESLQVSGRVQFLGFINSKETIRDLYQQCGVYCMPSANEGLPLAVLEAMSCGCSVVVTSIRAFEELVEENKSGLKIPVGNVELLTQAICKAWENRDRLGAEARRMVEQTYSLRAMAHRLVELMVSANTPDSSSATLVKQGSV